MKPVLAQRQKDVIEGSALDLDLTHLDKARALQAPTTLKYRIDDVTNNRQVLDWTTVVTPLSTNTVTITGAQNVLLRRHVNRQKMQVSVKTTSSSGDILQAPFYYDLVRIFERQDQLDT